MPEDKDRKIYPVKKPGKIEDIYEGIESHSESERSDGSEVSPTAPMEERSGPIVLSSSTYVEEDPGFEKEKRRPPEEQKKK